MSLRENFNQKEIERNMHIDAVLLDGICKVQCNGRASFEKFKEGLTSDNIKFEEDISDFGINVYFKLKSEYDFSSYGIGYTIKNLDNDEFSYE
jgi:hypothetical protein